MSETHAPVENGSTETAAPAAPVLQPGEQSHDITDDRSAGRALEGLLWADDEGDSSPETGTDAGADESQPTGTEEGTPEQPASRPVAIVAPISWSAEDKAEFAKLPPATQVIIARRESERDKAFQTRTQEIAVERQGWEAERTAITTQRADYIRSLQHLTALALPEAQQFQQVDWQKLAAENPAEYVRLSGARDALLGRINSIQGQLKRANDAQAADLQKQTASFLETERGKLVARVPEFGDEQRAPALAKEIRSFLNESYGFAETEVDSVVDHRLVALAADYMRLKKAETARIAAEGKRENTAPQMQRPGSTQGNDQTANGAMRGLVGNLGRTNSVRDAGKLLEKFL